MTREYRKTATAAAEKFLVILDFWAWPLFWRRVFLLTLPISFPLWAIVAGIFFLGVFGLLIVVGIPWILYETMWKDKGGEA